jgi:putative ABC transport system permease protein
LPGVRAAGAISRLPGTGDFHIWGVRATSGPLAGTPRGAASAQQRVVAGDYFRAVGIPLLEGRLFDASDDAHGRRHVVISKRLAGVLYPGADPIGQRLRTGGRDAEVVGVVAEVAVDNEGKGGQTVYHLHRQFAAREWTLMEVIAANGAAAAPAVQSAVRGVLAARDPQLVMYKPAMLDDVIGIAAAQRVFTLRILTTFAAVAIGLAALGLFGVLSYGVRLRSRELSIRMALGAESSAIKAMILRRGLVVTGVGLAIGLGGALLLSKLMASMLFRVSPFDPSVLVGAVVLMSVIGGFAAYLPARRAMSADPAMTLRIS